MDQLMTKDQKPTKDRTLKCLLTAAQLHLTKTSIFSNIILCSSYCSTAISGPGHVFLKMLYAKLVHNSSFRVKQPSQTTVLKSFTECFFLNMLYAKLVHNSSFRIQQPPKATVLKSVTESFPTAVLTVAYPQLVRAMCSIASTMSTPALRRNGSRVAWYRYMMLSISSVESAFILLVLPLFSFCTANNYSCSRIDQGMHM